MTNQKSFSQLWAEAREAEFQTKVAAVSEAWADDAVRANLLKEASEIVELAKEAGILPAFDAADTFTAAVTLVEDYIAKHAQGEAEQTKLAAEDEIAFGEALGEIVKEAGFTVEDIEALTAEEQEQLANLATAELQRRLEAENTAQ